MMFPALKKEIHLLLLKRISAVCLLSIVLGLGAALYLELRQLDATLVNYADKEARMFIPLLAAPSAAEDQDSAAGDRASAVLSLAHTAFIEAELYSRDRQLLQANTRANGKAIRARFAEKNTALSITDTASGDWIISDKRVYLAFALPLMDIHSEEAVGYLTGIYRLSLDDTRRLIWRITLSCGLVAGAILLCGLLMYPGLLLFQNQLIKNSAELNRANNFLLNKLGAALAKSTGFQAGRHSRLLIYGIRLAEQQKLSRAQIRGFIQGACLHQIGTLDEGSRALQGQPASDKKRRAAVQQHVKRTVSQIKRYRWLRSGLDVVRCAHEHYDGSGYPAGLSHDKIPLTARIFAIVEAFDSLSSPRPERQPLELEAALQTLEQQSGSHFDPVLLSPFIEMAPKLYTALINLDEAGLTRELDSVLKRYMKR
jgi:HD-GYP domain-containing protein (c-di-GMP phosphodiesterase class II)